MPIEHTNRRGAVYYLHEGRTKTNKPRYFFSQKREGTLAEAMPDGYEIYENPNAQVFLRKTIPQLVTAEEVATVEQAVRENPRARNFLIDVQKERIVVYLPDQDTDDLERLASIFRLAPTSSILGDIQRRGHYSPTMQFVLLDRDKRQFAVERWCFRGAIDGWFPLAGGTLQSLAAQYCRHLGHESFFELM